MKKRCTHHLPSHIIATIRLAADSAATPISATTYSDTASGAVLKSTATAVSTAESSVSASGQPQEFVFNGAGEEPPS